MSEERRSAESPEIPASLTTLILNIAATALAYLGHQLTPNGPQPEVNPTLARHAIDTLEVLKTKTEGNRTEEETRLLDELLTQLRLAYLAAGNKPDGKP